MFEPSTIRLVALWLQDLASDLDKRLPDQNTRGPARVLGVDHQMHESLAARLRDAAKRFLAAFRTSH